MFGLATAKRVVNAEKIRVMAGSEERGGTSAGWTETSRLLH
jgi:hypothetical protein